ncbi:hypothetical protein HNQ56_002525 [Anaerotaenia torta]|uniref:hypothetical protein n=1 Tax=Anaerotaenia torta TaxID=433293 RepID=UPI003D2457D2
MKVEENKIMQSFEKWCKKLRISPYWDIKLELNKIAARWPAKAVAQFLLSNN